MTTPKKTGMKSAYELAMERLEKSDGASKSLTPDQKAAIAEVEARTKAELAQIEIMAKQALADAQARGDAEKIREIEANRVRDAQRARDRGDEERDRIRQG